MANKRQEDKRDLKILKQQLETLSEECNHLHEVVDSYFKHVVNEVLEWENKPSSSQDSFVKLTLKIQQAIALFMANAIHFTGEEDEAKTDAYIVTTEGETTITEMNVCRDKAGSQKQSEIQTVASSAQPTGTRTDNNEMEKIAQSKSGIIKEKLKFQQRHAENSKDDRPEEDVTNESHEEDVTNDIQDDYITDDSGDEVCADNSEEEDGIKEDQDEQETYVSEEEDGRYDSQEDNVTDDSEQEEGPDDSQKGDGTNDSYHTKYESSLSYGTHETQVTKGEADLHKHVCCNKSPGHTQFVPFTDFNIDHLAKGYHDNDLVEFIKATGVLTVRIDVKITSTGRHKFWPDTFQPYPFSDQGGSDVTRLGTGMVWYVNKWTEEDFKQYHLGTCQCHNCLHSKKPSKVWGVAGIYTARQVVFDDVEARHTTCILFYDRQDSPLVTLKGTTVVRANTLEDWCLLNCATCDLDVLDKLYNMAEHWGDLWLKVDNKYRRSRNKNKMTFIVSHPHGCPKQVSVGHWINRYKVSDDESKYTYTTHTCPGSSGAHVHSLGYDVWLYSGHHVHSGVNSEGINYCAAALYEL